MPHSHFGSPVYSIFIAFYRILFYLCAGCLKCFLVSESLLVSHSGSTASCLIRFYSYIFNFHIVVLFVRFVVFMFLGFRSMLVSQPGSCPFARASAQTRARARFRVVGARVCVFSCISIAFVYSSVMAFYSILQHFHSIVRACFIISVFCVSWFQILVIGPIRVYSFTHD